MPPISHHQFIHTSTPFSSVLVLQQSSQHDSPPCLQRKGTRKLPRKIIHPTFEPVSKDNGPPPVKPFRTRSRRWILLRRLTLVLQRWIDMAQQLQLLEAVTPRTSRLPYLLEFLFLSGGEVRSVGISDMTHSLPCNTAQTSMLVISFFVSP